VLALPAAVVIGYSFAGIGLAAATFMRSWQDFDLIQLVQPADVPVQHDVLSAVDLSERRAVGRSLLAALPRDRARALVHTGAPWAQRRS